MSRVRDGAFLAVAAFALVLVFVLGGMVVYDRSRPSTPRRTVGECVTPLREGRSPPPDCGHVVINIPTDPSRRPYDPAP
jgi:hypothetical protein